MPVSIEVMVGIAVTLLVVGVWLWLRKYNAIAPSTIGQGLRYSILYVPVMGATSVFFSLTGGFNIAAVLLGIFLFTMQWAVIFRSPKFLSSWQKKPFKWAFIANSLIRLPLSFYVDTLLFLLQISLYEKMFGIHIEPVTSEFWVTLYLTITHGVLVQLFYGICLMIFYGVAIAIAKIVQRKKVAC